jgi:hypothetical protein
MFKLRVVITACVLALTVEAANADTFSVFDLSDVSYTFVSCFGPCPSYTPPFTLSGQITVDETTDVISAYPVISFTNGAIVTMGQFGNDYVLNYAGNVVGDVHFAFNDAGVLSSFTGGPLDQSNSYIINSLAVH